MRSIMPRRSHAGVAEVPSCRDRERRPMRRSASAGRCRARSRATSLTSAPPGVRLEETVDRVSGGNFELKFFEPGALVPGARVLRCSLQGLGRTPAARPPATTPARSRRWHSSPLCRSVRASANIHAWMIYGGGKDLQNEIYARHNLYSIELQHDRARDLGLVQRAGGSLEGPQGPQDALLRPRRAGHAQARRLDPAARRRRHLSGA